ncbi:MAG: non-hydrolyzing UDP-N-acetylglucosamine 2-epimerase [Methylocystaceae bacterium]
MARVLTVFGTRPEAIKMAPVVKALGSTLGVECLVAVTAQHREMLDQVLHLFKIKPDYDLDIMKERQDLYGITTLALNGLKDVIAHAKPDLVLVHGDTTTTFAGALAAFYQQVPVGHVEAGLRTFNKFAPFPEEMNRSLTGRLTDMHFAPTKQAKANLIAEGIGEEKIWVTGNTVIDALLQTVGEYNLESTLPGIDWSKRLILLTTHRRENWGEPMRETFTAIRELTEEYQDIEVIFPVHKNPVVSQMAGDELGGRERIHLIEPLDYEPFANLMNRSYLILTDSGGIQEEAPSLGKPVLVLRETTERPEALAAGTVKLVGTDRRCIQGQVRELLNDQAAYHQMAHAVNPFGDGQAAGRIASAVKNFLTSVKVAKQ